MTKKDILRRIYDLHAEVEVEHDKDRADAKRAEIAKLERQITSGGRDQREEPDHRGVRFGGSASTGNHREYSGNNSIQGRPNERLDLRSQSMEEYVRRAAENGVEAVSGTGRPEKMHAEDRDYVNDYFAARMGLKKSGEYRALNEDVSNSGMAITPQSWVGKVIDYLYPQTVFGRLGCSTTPMATEIVNVPQYAEPAAWQWTGEGTPTGIDSNPAFETGFQLNASGAYTHLLAISRELAQDAFVNGGLDDYLAQQVAKSFALTVDQAMLMGTSAPGCPGLINEQGFVIRSYTGDSGSGVTPADSTEPSIIAQIIREKNIEPTGFLSNVAVRGTYARLEGTSAEFPMFWPLPEDVQDLDWVTTANTNIVPKTEADNYNSGSPDNPALTGGSCSSLYAGHWPNVLMGVRLQDFSMHLQERLIEFYQIGVFAAARFSIRTMHPETFVRTGGILTTGA